MWTGYPPKINAIGALWFAAAVGAPAARGQQFEVASIKQHILPPNMFTFHNPGTNPIRISGNRVNVNMSTLTALVIAAYNVRDFQVSGGPAWALESRGALWDISAKGEGDAELSMDQARAMLRNLLADRFQLQLQFESKELPVYSLTIAKGGPKLKEVPPDAPRPAPPTARGSMEQVAATIGLFLDRPVVDKTGLTGVYDYTLDISRIDLARRAGDAVGAIGTALTAIQQDLGLKAEPGKAAIQMLIIDHAERPSDN